MDRVCRAGWNAADAAAARVYGKLFAPALQRPLIFSAFSRSQGFSIDMVVEGEAGRRLAIECDGDLYHGPERWAEALDTSTPSGRAMFQMLGVFAEFERGMIRERVNAGLARAKAKGTKLGRRPVKPAIEARIRELKAEGMGILKIGRTLGVGTSVVQRVVAET